MNAIFYVISTKSMTEGQGSIHCREVSLTGACCIYYVVLLRDRTAMILSRPEFTTLKLSIIIRENLARNLP